ncbi:MAG TPA: alpha/beta hydrolase [Cyclobacteriaceae bacterium]|nr:alpha/beta hydrolase [Cyclobacteriaceae bacterium]
MKKLSILILGVIVAIATAYAQSTPSATPAFHAKKSGKGEPVIFLPGFTCPGAVWDETIAHLNKQYETHVISYAGFNDLQPIKMPWYETIKKEMIVYIQTNKLKNIRIVGHSMGGMLAVDLASELPDQVRSIVAVDALPCLRELWMPGVPASSFKYDSPYNKQQLAATDETMKQTATMMSSSMTLNKEKADLIAKWTLEADRETYVYGYTDLLKIDLRDALTKVKAKTLILGAPYPDATVVTANMEKQYANLKTKNIVIAENSRHFIMFDQPEWFYGKVNSFLSE